MTIDKKLQNFILQSIEEEFKLRNKYYLEYDLLGKPCYEFDTDKFIECKKNKELPVGYYKLLELFGEDDD